MKKFAAKVVQVQTSRVNDPWGSGQYGASRGHRSHKGLDIKTKAGDKIYAPISGTLIREALPYAGDLRYRGLLLKGNGEWAGYIIKMFYVKGVLSGSVKGGQFIGNAQDLTKKYPNITNHIHLEVKKNGSYINPFDLWQMCF